MSIKGKIGLFMFAVMVLMLVIGVVVGGILNSTAAAAQAGAAVSQAPVQQWRSVGIRRPLAKVPQSGLLTVREGKGGSSHREVPPVFGTDVKVSNTNPHRSTHDTRCSSC